MLRICNFSLARVLLTFGVYLFYFFLFFLFNFAWFGLFGIRDKIVFASLTPCCKMLHFVESKRREKDSKSKNSTFRLDWLFFFTPHNSVKILTLCVDRNTTTNFDYQNMREKHLFITKFSVPVSIIITKLPYQFENIHNICFTFSPIKSGNSCATGIA